MEKDVKNTKNEQTSRRKAYEVKRRRARGRKIFKIIMVFLGLTAAAGLIFMLAFRINTVNVEGNTRYTKDEILDLIQFDSQPNNTVLFYLKNKNMPIEGVPFIDHIYINISGIDTIDIQVMEKLVIGCIEDQGQYIYFDTKGMVCEISDQYQSDVPKIEGLDFGEPQMGVALPIEDDSIYDALLTVSLLLDKYELIVEEIVFDENSAMSMHAGNIRVLLGRAENLEDKIAEYHNLLPQLEGLKGSLHLENYDSTKDSIIFSKE